jgi:hypothetical protein
MQKPIGGGSVGCKTVRLTQVVDALNNQLKKWLSAHKRLTATQQSRQNSPKTLKPKETQQPTRIFVIKAFMYGIVFYST